MVEQLVRFLGVSYDKAQLECTVEHCHQLIDQCCNAEALPVGRGMCMIDLNTFLMAVQGSIHYFSRHEHPTRMEDFFVACENEKGLGGLEMLPSNITAMLKSQSPLHLSLSYITLLL